MRISKGKLTKVGKTPEAIQNPLEMRTTDFDGTFDDYPAEGRRFVISGTPLNPEMGARVMETSAVKKVHSVVGNQTTGNLEVRFTTHNSEYLLVIES